MEAMTQQTKAELVLELNKRHREHLKVGERLELVTTEGPKGLRGQLRTGRRVALLRGLASDLKSRTGTWEVGSSYPASRRSRQCPQTPCVTWYSWSGAFSPMNFWQYAHH